MRNFLVCLAAGATLAACEAPSKPTLVPSGIWHCSTGALDRGAESVNQFSLKIDGDRFSFPNGDPTYKQQSITRKDGSQPTHSGILALGPVRDFDKNVNPPLGSRTHVILFDKETPTQSKWFYLEYNGSRPAEIFYLDKTILNEPPPYDGIIRSAKCKLGQA